MATKCYGAGKTGGPTHGMGKSPNSTGVNPYKTDFGGGNPVSVSNPRSRGW